MKNIIAKVLVPIAVLACLPASVAVAEPSAGMYGADTLAKTISAVADKVTPKVVVEQYEATVTAYNSELGQTDSDPWTAANGKQVHVGMVACSRDIPFDAVVTMKFKSGRVFKGTCGDRMAKKYDHATNLSLARPHFDIWMLSRSDAKQFGRQLATVTVEYQNL